ncbi:zonadhesin-like [Oppia nitens]|uniref:zonadhesin-like n=1 Tax=Oppia nitens TaxID=1686743 RepID=UPI0023D9E742|nr:zonadhesin-like [Oppia nitens]
MTTESDKKSTTVSVTDKPEVNCGLNQYYNTCGSQCSESCKLFANGIDKPTCGPECTPGCYCNKGLFRNSYGACVPKDQCQCKSMTSCDGPNEMFFWCYHECGRTCADYMHSDINANCPDKCSRGCFCKDGFVRNKYGMCLPTDDCNMTVQMKCGSNEIHMDCGSDCGRHCHERSKSGKDLECFSCKMGCYCAEGYYRSDSGQCVTEAECPLSVVQKPNKKCSSNEIYTDCGNFCDQLCTVLNKDKLQLNCSLTCAPGCICRDGYKRNKLLTCVAEDDCRACDENEEFSKCGTDCGHHCNDLLKDNIPCPLVCNIGCFCNSGYYRNKKGKCVTKSTCDTDPILCNTNEEYLYCGNHCGETCEDLRNPIHCPKVCEKGCFCKHGYYRDIDGNCLTKDQCDLEQNQEIDDQINCKTNEEYRKCGNKCLELCEDSMHCTNECQKGCFCSVGYLRHKSGHCVPEDKCNVVNECLECDANEYYTSCGSDCGKHCYELKTVVADTNRTTECTKSCKKGCFCKHGFRRNGFGKCF